MIAESQPIQLQAGDAVARGQEQAQARGVAGDFATPCFVWQRGIRQKTAVDLLQRRPAARGGEPQVEHALFGIQRKQFPGAGGGRQRKKFMATGRRQRQRTFGVVRFAVNPRGAQRQRTAGAAQPTHCLIATVAEGRQPHTVGARYGRGGEGTTIVGMEPELGRERASL